MIKYQVPTTPTTYALWYTYVAQTNPQLNQAIDRSISKQGLLCCYQWTALSNI